METFSSIPCNLCKQRNISFLYRKEGYTIARCHSCGVLFRVPKPTSEELRQMYTEAYYHPWNLEKEELVKKIKMKTFERRLQEIQKYVRSGKILDVGCATGFFLEEAQSKGFEPYGIELSEFSFKEGERKFGDHIYLGTIEEIPFESNFFDVITMFDLLEHVKNPLTTLRCCRRILKPRGIIAAVLPDTSSISAQLMRKNWTHYKEEHLFYFSKKTISCLLKQELFNVIKVVPAIKVISLKYIYNHQFKYQPRHPITLALSILLKMLPQAIQNTRRRETFFSRRCWIPPETLVMAAKARSVPTARTGSSFMTMSKRASSKRRLPFPSIRSENQPATLPQQEEQFPLLFFP